MAAAGAILNDGIVSAPTLGGYVPMDQQLFNCFLPNGYNNNTCNDNDDDEFISDDNDVYKSLFAEFPILDHLDSHYPISDYFDPGVFDMDENQYPDEDPLPADILLPDLFENAAATALTTPFEYHQTSSHHHHHHHHHHHPSSSSSSSSSAASLPLALSPSTAAGVFGSLLLLPEGEEGDESRSSSSSSREFTNIPVFVESGSVSEDERDEDSARQSRSRLLGGCGGGVGSKFNWENGNKYVVPRSIADGVESTITAPRRVRRRKDQLWYFLLEILGDPEYNPNYIQWENKDQGIFRFIESKKVAQLWGAKKKRSGMSYEYFARAMRHYYSRGIMRRVTGRRLVYQFGPKAENWKGYAQQVTVTNRSKQDNADDIGCSC